VWRGQVSAAGWQSDASAREECLRAVAACFAAAHDGGAALVFSLFALEAWHLAQRLGVPAVAAAPYVVPYAMPAAFGAAIEASLPELADALRAAPCGTLGWRELEHWMWPLWTVRGCSMLAACSS
jgi:hypothetical protein